MNIDPTTVTRTRNTMLRQLATQAAINPRLVDAVVQAIKATLPSVVDEELRKVYGGETARFYSAQRDVMEAEQSRQERDRRIAALAAPPSSLSAAAIARQEGITPHRVRQILRAAERKSGNAAA